MQHSTPFRRKFVDSDVFIIGGGPSLRDFWWGALRGKNTIGCNAAFRLGADICNVCFFSDHPWYEKFREELDTYAGSVATHCHELARERPPWMHYMPRATSGGLYLNALGGGNSGSAAINLALLMGARRVFLLGYDGSLSSEGKSNWHDNSCDKPDARVYPYFDADHAAIARDLPSVFPGRSVINLNPNSTIAHFPKANPEDFL